MNDELKKNMGLEIGRVIHLHSGDQDALYNEIMSVAVNFIDLSHVQAPMNPQELQFDAEAETEEIIPDN